MKEIKMKLAKQYDKEHGEIALESVLNALYYLEDVVDYDLRICDIINTLKRVKFVEESDTCV